jgi:hypothetical protein
MMYTVTFGVEESYESLDFYNRDKNFELEKKRINGKFENLSKLGMLT